jgi:uncharacterized CHY-type Zn-finger protein
MTRDVHGVEVFGVDVDPETRCRHWHSETDIIALRFKCCGRWYPCFDCHAELADHPHRVWPKSDLDEQAVLCGACGKKLSVSEYLACDSICPVCKRNFNPGCAGHYHLYFEV